MATVEIDPCVDEEASLATSDLRLEDLHSTLTSTISCLVLAMNLTIIIRYLYKTNPITSLNDNLL